jgi:hypothetical protein
MILELFTMDLEYMNTVCVTECFYVLLRLLLLSHRSQIDIESKQCFSSSEVSVFRLLTLKFKPRMVDSRKTIQFQQRVEAYLESVSVEYLLNLIFNKPMRVCWIKTVCSPNSWAHPFPFSLVWLKFDETAFSIVLFIWGHSHEYLLSIYKCRNHVGGILCESAMYFSGTMHSSYIAWMIMIQP